MEGRVDFDVDFVTVQVAINIEDQAVFAQAFVEIRDFPRRGGPRGQGSALIDKYEVHRVWPSVNVELSRMPRSLSKENGGA